MGRRKPACAEREGLSPAGANDPEAKLLLEFGPRPARASLPVALWHTPEVATALRRHFGLEDDFALWQALGLDKLVWDFLDYKTEGTDHPGRALPL